MDGELKEVLETIRQEMRQGFDAVDQRFGAMDESMRQGFDAVDQRFDSVDQRFGAIDQRFDSVDQRFVAIDHRFDSVDQRFGAVDRRFDSVDRRIGTLETRVDRSMVELRHELRVNLDNAMTEMRQDNAAAHSETRLHFDTVADGLRKEIKLIAEGVLNVDEKLEREVGAIREEIADLRAR